jgi:hypothetical protein
MDVGEHLLGVFTMVELLYPGLDCTLLLPSGMVLMYLPLHHVYNTLSAKVVHTMLMGCLSFFNIFSCNMLGTE